MWFAGSPGSVFPTSVNDAPPSRVTCRVPSSVPTHTRPAVTGDSSSAVIVLNAVTPSCLDNMVRSPGTPMISILERSICFVTSALAVHEFPRSVDLNSRLPPSHTVLGLCGESMNGVFQLNRYTSPGCAFVTLGCPPPPPPPPPPPAPPPPPCGAPGRLGARGRMLCTRPVRRSYRFVFPFCDSL